MSGISKAGGQERQWPHRQEPEVRVNPNGQVDTDYSREDWKKMFRKFQQKSLALINFQGIIGLQPRRDKWHAETDGELGPKYARVLTRTTAGGWNIYYFLRTLEHSLSNEGHLPPLLYSRALVHFRKKLL